MSTKTSTTQLVTPGAMAVTITAHVKMDKLDSTDVETCMFFMLKYKKIASK